MVYVFLYRCAVSSSGVKATVQFPVQFEEASIGFPLEPQAPPPCLPHSTADGAPQSPTEPLFPLPLAPPLSHPGPWHTTPAAPSDPPTLELSSTAEKGSVAEPREGEQLRVPEAEWRVSDELRLKCHKQFEELQPSHGRLQGDEARAFFIKSRLPNADLSSIW